MTLSTAPQEKLLPLRGQWVSRRWRCALLARDPTGEVRGRVHNQEEMHPGVLDATKFRAQSAEDTRLVDLEGDRIGLAGDHVHLTRDLRNPEAVNHVI